MKDKLKLSISLCLRSLKEVPDGELEATKQGIKKIKKSIGMISSRPLTEWIFCSLDTEDVKLEIKHKQLQIKAAIEVTSSGYVKWFFDMVYAFFNTNDNKYTKRIELITVLRIFTALNSGISIIIKRSDRSKMKFLVGDSNQSDAAMDIYRVVSASGTESAWFEVTMCLSSGCSIDFIRAVLDELRDLRVKIRDLSDYGSDEYSSMTELDIRNSISIIREGMRLADFVTLENLWGEPCDNVINTATVTPDLLALRSSIVTKADSEIYNSILGGFKV